MASFKPPPEEQQYYAAPPMQQQYAYSAQPQPSYNPGVPQQHWGHDQGAQQQYFGAAPAGPTQGQPITGVMPPSYETAPHGTINPESGLPAKFNPRPRYNDCWAFLLFIAQLAAFVVLSYYAISQIHKNRTAPDGFNNGRQYQPGSSPYASGFFSKSGIITMFISILTGAIIAVLYFLLTEAFPRQMIKITLVLSIIVYIAVAVYYFVRRLWMPAIFSTIFAALYAMSWFWWQSRIPFATEMLRAVTAISKKYPATFVLALFGLVVQIAYSVYFITVIAGCYELYYDRETGSAPGKLKALIVFCFFSFYWTSQVLKNIVHVTIAGVFATYYFMAGSPQGMSKSPTVASFKRACTTSIGSICFGSLIIAIIQTLRALAQMLRGDGNDGVMAFLACIIDCILGCLQGLIDYVNKYAFCQVAIYGKAYIPAARDTWTILKDRGIVQIINDNLIGNVWAMGAIMGGVLCGLAGYLYLRFANPAFNVNGQFTYVIVVMAFVLGMQMMFTVGTVIDSGVATTFVCLAEDPAALARTNPELFERIRATWPAVVQGVN